MFALMLPPVWCETVVIVCLDWLRSGTPSEQQQGEKSGEKPCLGGGWKFL